jgi:hypothetical protein
MTKKPIPRREATDLDRALMLVTRLEHALEGAPLTVKGPQGLVAHPLLRQLDAARRQVRALRRAEGVPDAQRVQRQQAGADARAGMRAHLEGFFAAHPLLGAPRSPEQWEAIVEHNLTLARRGLLAYYRGPC